MKKECKVIILPTNNIPTNGIQPMNYYSGVGKVRLGVPTTGAEARTMQQNGCQAFHLYIVSDDTIETNDWVYNEKGIVNANHAFLADLANMFRSNKKIIASTDLSLGLPSIPKDFIQKYCENGGIDEVMVEYIPNGFQQEVIQIGAGNDFVTKWTPIVLSDNTITIHPVKNNWTREEVVELLYTFGETMEDRNYIRPYYRYEDWIEKNL